MIAQKLSAFQSCRKLIILSQKMNTVQGKNVVIVGGLQGMGLKLTKNLLNKRVKNLYIVDLKENQVSLQRLKNQYQNTNIYFNRISEFTFMLGIQLVIQDISSKAQQIDIFINALELLIEENLQRTMDLNMKIYLSGMMAAVDVMDMTKSGRGGKIVNVLSNLGLENIKSNDYQYLINKQMLLSLSEVFSEKEFYDRTGVAVITVTPVINKDLVDRNKEWIQEIGLDKLVNEIDNVNNFNKYKSASFDDDDDYCNEKTIFDFEIHNFHQDNTKQIEIYKDDANYYQEYDPELEERLRESPDSILKVFNKLCFNIVRGVEKGESGSKIVVGLEGLKNIDGREFLSRL